MQYIPTSLPSIYRLRVQLKKDGNPSPRTALFWFLSPKFIRNEESIKIHPRTSKIQPVGVHSSRNQRAEGAACETGAGRGEETGPGLDVRGWRGSRAYCLAETGRTPLEGCGMLEPAAGFIATLLTLTPELDSSRQTELGVGISIVKVVRCAVCSLHCTCE